ncbi:hypothetical protein [Bacillus horti]|uniref:Uncharacterized protein n=1 Tax=Caldalkalibacillus horti TaxID=77523 RepID=A0ABT9W4N1_9BACI|nr:hypothetical protein [Bacillus horti]MDQ0168203.1 hypothetical protein [Bacillus horti]
MSNIEGYGTITFAVSTNAEGKVVTEALEIIVHRFEKWCEEQSLKDSDIKIHDYDVSVEQFFDNDEDES